MKDIKAIFVDLDHTTLTSERIITENTLKKINECIKNGCEYVVATGRGYTSIPDEVFDIRGIRYFITSNGASIYYRDMMFENAIYNNCMDSKAVEDVHTYLKKKKYNIEVFAHGTAHIGNTYLSEIMLDKVDNRVKEYVCNTREPVADIYDFMLGNKHSIESISIYFEDLEQKPIAYDELKNISNISVTSSLHHNLEIGGATTNKATAVEWLCNKISVDSSEIICCGDNFNDVDMIKFAGLGVAVANSSDDVKVHADYITDSNDEEGVANVIDKFVLKNV